MPTPTQMIIRLQQLRREIRDLAKAVKGSRTADYTRGYLAGVRHAASIVTRAIRRAGDHQGA